MKTIKTAILTLSLLMVASISKAQSLYHVHEDQVKLNMVQEYEGVVKELVDNMKKYNIPNVKFIVTNLVDSRYLYVQPIENMADLDKHPLGALAEKMGKEAMSDLFNRMDKCYDVELDYVINLNSDLSYMPNGITQTPEGQDYRKFHYLYVSPGNRALIKEKMMAVKDLFAKKGSKEYYRVYESGFGTNGEFYMVAIAAKDEVDYAQKGLENQTLLGEEGNQVLGDLFSHLLKYEEHVGMMRPDLAYAPK